MAETFIGSMDNICGRLRKYPKITYAKRRPVAIGDIQSRDPAFLHLPAIYQRRSTTGSAINNPSPVVDTEPVAIETERLVAIPPIAIAERYDEHALRPIVSHEKRDTRQLSNWLKRRIPKPSLGMIPSLLIISAIIVFGSGLYVAISSWKTNNQAQAVIQKLSQAAASVSSNPGSSSKPETNNVVVPSVIKPTPQAVLDYTVSPNHPRYLKIPTLGVDARVFSVGTTTTGALGTPDNVFDTAWYNKSAEPGQPGAVLIDGHISSWTSKGVFYGLKTLKPGDAVQIVTGNGAVFNYKVVKTQIYPSTDVNMQATVTPVVAGVPGLNLISCSGDVIPGTSLFNERIVVFTEQVTN